MTRRLSPGFAISSRIPASAGADLGPQLVLNSENLILIAIRKQFPLDISPVVRGH